MTINLEDELLESWTANASSWIEVVQKEAFESRKLVTNDAILDALTSFRPSRILDVGCGEGWLVRSLRGHGIDAVGIDAIASLIDEASKGPGTFHHLSYQTLRDHHTDLGRYDGIVANFSLLGEHAVSQFLNKAPAFLNPGGRLVIQTLSPMNLPQDQPYEDGWKTEEWLGTTIPFARTAPWYFRTLGSWISMLRAARFELLEVREPLHPISKKAVSMIFIARVVG